MRRFFFFLIGLVIAAVLIGYAVSKQTGYVLIAFKNFRYESSLWTFLAILVLIWLAWQLIRLVMGLLGVSGRVINPWSRYNRHRRMQLAERNGFRELAEGNWKMALRHLRKAGDLSEYPLLSYLGASRAANELGRYDEADDLLNLTHEKDPESEFPIGLTRAQLWINRGDHERAREVLTHLHQLQPRHRAVLHMLQQLYVTQHDWRALCLLMPTLRKEKVLDEQALQDLERHAWAASIRETGEQGMVLQGEERFQPLEERWKNIPSVLRRDPALVASYASQLNRLGNAEEAEKILRQTLKQQYDERLIVLYGKVASSDPAKQLQFAERCLDRHPEDPGLLLTLGRLSQRNQLWGKARDYFEASLKLQLTPEICAELGRLLAQLGDVERSNQLFQQGLNILVSRSPATSVQAIPALPPVILKDELQ